MADAAATVDAWTLKSKARLEAVFHGATQRTASLAIENLRTVVHVQTGFLRASMRGSLESMPPIDPSAYPAPGQTYGFDGGEISLVIANAKAGDTIYIGMTAAYSGFIEFGTRYITPRGYIRLATLEWQQSVSQAIEAAKSSVASRAA